MKAIMPTVQMPPRDWVRVLNAVGALQLMLKRGGKAREADEMGLIGRQIARCCRHQARAAREEKVKKGG